MLAVAAGLTVTEPVFAHAHLKSASPAPKAVVKSAPKEVSINFTEALEPRFSTIAVKDSAGAQVDAGDVHVAPDDAKHLAVTLKALTPGTYTVIWHATSIDTHKSEGSYVFEVAP
jgi:methionine-rich copper-binding protein CopC